MKNRLRVALAAVALLFTTLTLAPAHARADSPTSNADGTFTITRSGNTFTITHAGPTPAANWSCTVLNNSFKVGSLPILAAQGYQSCSMTMKYVSLRFYYHSCFSDWFGTCWLPGTDQNLGVTCLVPNVSSQWCPANGTYNVGVPIGSFQQTDLAAQSSDYSGVTASATYPGPVISF